MDVYEARPWLAKYPEDWPTDLELEHETALAAFSATVTRLPDSPAIHYFERSITFRELNEISDAFAVGLLAEGFSPGDRLAVYTQNVPQFVIAMIATWKAGGILVSVNPMYKAREVLTLLRDSGATAVLALESLWEGVAAEVASKAGLDVVVTTSELDFVGTPVPEVLVGSTRRRMGRTIDLLELVQRHRGAVPDPGSLDPGSVALLTYTSGTTGPPKGAMNTHANIVFNAQTYREWGALTNQDTILGIAPLFHVTGLVGHIAVSMLCGAPLVLFHRFDARTALELAERHRATFTVGAITAFTALMAHPDFEQRDLSALTKVLSGGAPIAPAVLESFSRRSGGVYIHNIYGLTETTSPSHVVPRGVRAPVDPASGALSVGLPVFNTHVRVIDESGASVDCGQPGELATRGPQVVPGYWEKPDETRSAFSDGEFATGDVGFMNDEGWFFVIDRKKDQINASGFKIWPREVEDVIYEHPAVREVAVVGVADAYRGETVKAFVSLNPGAHLDADGLIDFCKARLAAYKYPREVEFLRELPKTASGKILRRELRSS